MNITDKLQALRDHKGAHVEIGRSFFLGSKGWLSIDDKDTHFAVMYTSDKDTHGPLSGPAYMLEINKQTGARQETAGLSGAWKSALSMWPVRGADEIAQVEKIMRGHIDAAYEYNGKPHVMVPSATPQKKQAAGNGTPKR